MLRLERLGTRHHAAILAGQDALLAEEIIGRPWNAASLAEFLTRCAGWREDGPLQELAALDVRTGALLGGGGLHRLAPGLARDQAMLTYWLLAPARGRGMGVPLAEAIVERARRDPRAAEAVLLIAPENTASQAVARRIGALPTGEGAPHPAGGSRRAERWLLPLRGEH